MRYLLDTNAWIHYIRDPRSAIRTKLQLRSPPEVVVCSVVKAELWHGAEKYANRTKRLSILQTLFKSFASLPFDDAAASVYGPLKHFLETKGKVIGPNDLAIAAICLANNLTLVSDNVGEFSRVPGLALENWLLP